MIFIVLMIVFPLTVSLFNPTTFLAKDESSMPIFDTTIIAGYSFFKQEGISIDEHSQHELYNAVYALLGTPHRNRAGGSGLDCSGLVRKVFRQTFGIQLKGGSRDMYRISKRIATGELQEADLLFFTINSRQVNHVGIYLSNGKFVHTSSTEGVAISDMAENYYSKHYFGAGRIAENK